MLEVLIWLLTALLMLGGVIGVIVPLLPGTTLILLAAVLHKLLLPLSVGWLTIGVIAAVWLLSLLLDLAGVALGTRWLGGSKWGMAGASGGALVGVFISLPAILLGTMLRAVAAEKFLGRKSDREALRSGLGAVTGFALATVARLACAAAMIGIFGFAAVSRVTA